MSEHDENKAVVGRLVEEVWNRANYDLVDDLVAEEYVGHPSGVVGTDAYRKYYLDLRGAFPDLRFTVEDQIAEGDKVVTRWTCGGTHQGPFAGLQPTGRKGSIAGTSTHRLAGGKVVECWTNMDDLGLLQQLGAIPTPQAA
jgi:steroid delta-isomerase-like uncharacterized protein